MPIRYAHSVELARSSERAFDVLDDFALTPKWLERCARLEALTPGPHEVGTKLKYDYREGGRTGSIDGEIVRRTPNERLTMRYLDKMMEVTVDFEVAKTGGGAKLTHTIEITPRTFVARLFSPLIKRAVPKQTLKAMDPQKSLLESDGS